MPPNLPDSRIAPRSPLCRQYRVRNIYKSELGLKPAYYMNYALSLACTHPWHKHATHSFIFSAKCRLYISFNSFQRNHFHMLILTIPLSFLSDTSNLPPKLWSDARSESIHAHHSPWWPHRGHFPFCASPESTCCCCLLLPLHCLSVHWCPILTTSVL